MLSMRVPVRKIIMIIALEIKGVPVESSKSSTIFGRFERTKQRKELVLLDHYYEFPSA